MRDRRGLHTGFFASTGLFALVGAIYTWGDGVLWLQPKGIGLLLPVTDLLTAMPLSFLTAYGFWCKKRWALPLGLVTCGVYVFGSFAVYTLLWVQGPPYPWKLILPPIAGLTFSAYYIHFAIGHYSSIQKPSS